LPEMIERNRDTRFTVLLTRSASKYVNDDFDNLERRLVTDGLRFGPARAWYDRHCMAGLLRHLAADVYFLPHGFMPRNCPCPTVMTFQNLYFLHAREYPQWRPPSLGWRVYENIREREYLRHLRTDLLAACRIVAISTVAKEELIDRCGISGEKIRIAGLAATPEFAPAGDPETDFRNRASVGVSREYMLSVGALAPNKNIDQLLNAYQVLVQRVESCPELVIAGPDWRGLSSQVRAMIASHGLTERVRLLGLVDSATLASLYRGAIATVQLSDCEAFGLPAIEAMACGSPTIVANRSGLAEVGGDGAIQVDPFESATVMRAMHKLLTNRSSREGWKRRALVRAAQFSWQTTADVTFEAIAEAAGWVREHQPEQDGLPTEKQSNQFLGSHESDLAHACLDDQPRQDASIAKSLI
jgi:glycosyltransferase involved in cell wall biosynthesis